MTCVLCLLLPPSILLREQPGSKMFPVCQDCWDSYLATGVAPERPVRFPVQPPAQQADPDPGTTTIVWP